MIAQGLYALTIPEKPGRRLTSRVIEIGAVCYIGFFTGNRFARNFDCGSPLNVVTPRIVAVDVEELAGLSSYPADG